jgi:hypothetical protein
MKSMTDELKTILSGIDEEDIDRITNKKVTIAKRIWGQKKREIVQTDSIASDERVLFDGDQYLALLVIQRENIEKEIIDYIDKRLASARPHPEE